MVLTRCLNELSQYKLNNKRDSAKINDHLLNASFFELWSNGIILKKKIKEVIELSCFHWFSANNGIIGIPIYQRTCIILYVEFTKISLPVS